ncbi:MAG: sugar phosphate isomerase/epimerase family protein [Massiliimalia sp.]|jgi:sugar phosphate isomerase/epimerase
MDFGMPTLVEHCNLEKDAALCNHLGLKFVEINMSFPMFQLKKLSQIQIMESLASKHNIYYTIHLDENMDLFSFNPAVRKAHLQTLLQVIEISKALQIPTLNMHLNPGVYITLPEKRVYLLEACWSEYEKQLTELSEACTDAIGNAPIRICIENTEGFAPFQKQAICQLLQSPVFALTWDIGHSYTTDNRDEPFLLEHQSSLKHFHIHDANITQCHLPLGAGDIDLTQRLSLAERCGARCVLETKTTQALTDSVTWIHENTSF